MKTWTSRVMARALNCAKRTVLLTIGDRPATEPRLVRGQNAKAWSLCALPVILQERLSAAAMEQNFRNAEAMLDHFAREDAALPSPSVGVPSQLAVEAQAVAQDALALVADPAHPSLLTARDVEYVWGEISAHLVSLEVVADLAEVKASLAAWLAAHAPALAASVRTMERKLAAYKARGVAALVDARSKRSGNYRASLCSKCWEKALTLNMKLGGEESHTWRTLKLKGLLCPDCDQRHKFDVRKAKSRVPQSIRQGLTPITDKALHFAKSDSAGRMAGPYVNRDWSDTKPGDTFVADDVSWNHKIYTTAADGRLFLCRPECLYICDARTSYPLHYLMIPGDPGIKASYSGDPCRLLFLQTHDLLGLPNIDYLLENGPWRSRTVRDEQAGGKWMSFAELELGLKNLKHFVGIRHAKPRTPRSKPVENDFGILQRRMRAEPGFVGFNERAEKSDRMKRLERDFENRVKEGKEHPGNEFFSLEQFNKRIGEIVMEFAHEPQNGVRLAGRSPAEAWGAPALRKLPAEARWIFATRRELVKVTGRGLVIKGRSYANDELNRYLGEQVWAFYNLEYPQLLTVCDRKREHYFSVAQCVAPAMTARDTAAGRAALKRSQNQIDDFNRPARIIGGSIPHERVFTIERDLDANEAHREIGRHMATQITAHKTAAAERNQARRRQDGEADRLRAEALMGLPSDDSTIIAP